LGEDTLNAAKLIVAGLATSAASMALAGPTVPLGTALGRGLGLDLGGRLGATLGFLLGSPLGSVLPIASVTLLGVSAMGLAAVIYMVLSKNQR
jgi:hypothetical protein